MTLSSNPPHDQDQIADLLAAAAFGSPSESELAELEAILENTPEARAEYASLQMLAADLALIPDERTPSAGLRDRLEQAVTSGTSTPSSPAPAPAVAAVPTALPAPSKEPGNMRMLRPAYRIAAAAAIVLALIGGILVDRFVLQSEDNDMQEIAYDMTLPDEVPDLSAELLYDPDTEVFMLKTENMPSAPDGQVYQIWLIDHESVPHSMGVMNAAEFAMTANRENYAAFAITTEPGPLGSEGPTSDPFFVAPLT